MTSNRRSSRRIFLSYAHDDTAEAQLLRRDIEAAGLVVVDPSLELSAGEGIQEKLRRLVQASDVVVQLLSPNSIANDWVAYESQAQATSEAERRGVELVPALIRQVELPATLSGRGLVDLSQNWEQGSKQLIAQLKAASVVDFSRLDHSQFESLVADLLRASGFAVRRDPQEIQQADMVAERLNPGGSTEQGAVLVEVKFYSHDRVDVRAINQLSAAIPAYPNVNHGLLVTNGHLTSVAQDYLDSLSEDRQGAVRVLDGAGLHTLLRQNPEIAERYFVGPDNPVGAAS